MSLVDQFLADDNEELNQYTQSSVSIQQQNPNQLFNYNNFDQNQGDNQNIQIKPSCQNNSYKNQAIAESQQNANMGSGGFGVPASDSAVANRKQLLQDFKKKYNFYNDSSSEEEEEEEHEEQEEVEDKNSQQENDQEQEEDHDHDESDDQVDNQQLKQNLSDDEEHKSDQLEESHEQQHQSQVDSDEDQHEEADDIASEKQRKLEDLKRKYQQYSSDEDSDHETKEIQTINKNSIKDLPTTSIPAVQTQAKSQTALEDLKKKYQFSSSDEEDQDSDDYSSKNKKAQINQQNNQSRAPITLENNYMQKQSQKQHFSDQSDEENYDLHSETSSKKSNSRESQSQVLENVQNQSVRQTLQQFKKFTEPKPSEKNISLPNQSQELNLEEMQRLRYLEREQQQQQMLKQQALQQQLESQRSQQTVFQQNIVNQNAKDSFQEEHDEYQSEHSENDFYQLSDIDNSNYATKKQDQDYTGSLVESDNYSQNPQQHQMKSSIAQVTSMLDSQIQNYDKLLSQSQLSDRSHQQPNSQKLVELSHINQSQPQVRKQDQQPQQEKSTSEMTFNDLSDLDSSYSKNQERDFLHSVISQKQQNYKQQTSALKSQPPVHQSVIDEEDLEESQLNESLNYSQNTTNSYQTSNYLQSKLMNLKQSTGGDYFTNNKASQNIQQKDTNAQEGQENCRNLVLKMILQKNLKQVHLASFRKWKENATKEFYSIKLKNAALMVDKMSKFSRSFISLNSLSQIIVKNKQRQAARAMIKWTRFTHSQNTQQNENNQQNNSKDKETILMLQQKLEEKDQEILRMEQMFKEYSNWKIKLEQIEQKMKSESDYWKTSCEKLQRENEKLQREAMKVTQSLMEKTKEIESKENTIETLQKKLKTASQKIPLDTVEEVVCPHCQNSLEESQIFTGRMSTRRDSRDPYDNSQEIAMINELNDKLTDLEKQVMIYRERVHYHESIEEELKKNIESQVDVVLKMEEERLMILKEKKEMLDKNRNLTYENDDYKSKITLFQKELEELQEQIKEQHQMQQKFMQDRENNQTSVLSGINQTEDESNMIDMSYETSSQMSKMTLNKENKSVNIKKKATTSTLTAKPKAKKPSGLKFQTSQGVKVGENSAIFSSSLKQQIQAQEDSQKSKYGAEPVNKQLVSDNQLLTNELVMMGREISKLKGDLRVTQDQLKKSEKEKYDVKKNLEGKDTAVDKLRKERDELWAVVNTDKYKNIKVMEQEKEKILTSKTEAELQISKLNEQITQQLLEMEQQQLKIQELEFTSGKSREKESQREKLLEVLDDKARKSEIELSHQRQNTQKLLDEVDTLKTENSKLKKDVDWLANSAKNNKLQAERAISDLEAYTKILRGMEKKLAEVEVEKESKETELKEIRQKMLILQQHQQQMQQQSPLTNQYLAQQQQQQQQYQMQFQQQFQQQFNAGWQQQQQLQNHNSQMNLPPQQNIQSKLGIQMNQAPPQNQKITAQRQQVPSQNQQQQQQFIQQQQQQPQSQQPQSLNINIGNKGVPQPQQPPQRFF